MEERVDADALVEKMRLLCHGVKVRTVISALSHIMIESYLDYEKSPDMDFFLSQVRNSYENVLRLRQKTDWRVEK